MSNQELMSITLAFRQEDDGTYSIRNSIPEGDLVGYFPVKTLPVDILQMLVHGLNPEETPPALVKELALALAARKAWMNKEEITAYAVELIQDAVDGKVKVTLKDPTIKFDYMKENVVLMFDDVEIIFYIEGFGGDPDPEDIQDGNMRYVSSVKTPDGNFYDYGVHLNDVLATYEDLHETNADRKFTKLRQLLDVLETLR